MSYSDSTLLVALWLGVAKGLCLGSALAILILSMCGLLAAFSSLKGGDDSAGVFTAEETLAHALACPSRRADALNVLAGAVYEFGSGLSGTEAASELLHLASAADATAAYEDADAAEGVLGELVPRLAAIVDEWPKAARESWSIAIRSHSHDQCEQGPNHLLGSLGQQDVTIPLEPLRLVVDHASTTEGAMQHDVISRTGRYFTKFASKMGLVFGRELQLESRPADVVVGQGNVTRGDCFAFRGNGSIALRVLDERGDFSSAIVHRLVLEQPSRWMVPDATTSPRRFLAYGILGDSGTNKQMNLHSGVMRDVLLGAFEYSLAAPAAQTFDIASPVPVHGLYLDFDGEGWGARYTCVYRIRAFGTVEQGGVTSVAN
jgi:hypothetical protein